MAAPTGVWLAFGFSPEEAAGEPGPGPGPWRLEASPEGIFRVWPAWSYVVVETGERSRPARSPGASPSRGPLAGLCPLPPAAPRDGGSRSHRAPPRRSPRFVSSAPSPDGAFPGMGPPLLPSPPQPSHRAGFPGILPPGLR